MTITEGVNDEILHRYRNGDYWVTLLRDGTKQRVWDETTMRPAPEFPESVDVKITDHCDAGCPWCHESSTVRGRHGDVALFTSFAKGLPGGTELAIGGGNPMAHPRLEEILQIAKESGKVANITVNSRHIREERGRIERLAKDGLVHGVGVSFDSKSWEGAKGFVLSYPHSVVHLIAGVDSPAEMFRMAKDGVQRFLVLGYKVYGRGARGVAGTHARRMQEWHYWLPRMIFLGSKVVLAFDNLALSCLRVASMVTEESWDRSYMGAEGEFSMFYDVVEDRYAVSSTSERKWRNGRSAKEMFADIRPGKVFFPEVAQ